MAAAATTTTFLGLLLLSLLAVTASTDNPAAIAGGRTEIKNVGSNKEVQSLGRFAVAEHNRRLRHSDGGTAAPLLAFSRVLEAQEQVVAGVAYYLKVVARDRAGGEGEYDAVVVVKAWLKSKELVSFTPSPK